MAYVQGLRCRECGADYPDGPLVINAHLQDFDRLLDSFAPAQRRAAGRE